MNCKQCGAGNAKEQNYCGSCGAVLDPRLATAIALMDSRLAAFIDSELGQRVSTAIKEQLKDQSAVEVELSSRILERLTSWGKTFSFFVAIPLALLLILFTVLGFTNYLDFRRHVADAKAHLLATLDSAQTEADSATKEVDKATSRAHTLTQNIGVSEQVLKNLSVAINGLQGGPQAVQQTRTGETTLGVDASPGSVSSWTELRASGVRFVIIKATSGTTRVDPYFARYWQAAKQSGFVRGAYHYFKLHDTGRSQAEFLVRTVPREDTDFLILDVEAEEIAGASPMQIAARMKEFIDRIQELTGRKPVIYVSSGLSGIDKYISFSGYPLWLAYNISQVPNGWGNWAFRQYTSTQGIRGIANPVVANMDVFNGSLDQLRSIGGT